MKPTMGVAIIGGGLFVKGSHLVSITTNMTFAEPLRRNWPTNHPLSLLFSNASSSASKPSTQGLSNQLKKRQASFPTQSPSRIFTLRILALASRIKTFFNEMTSPPSLLPSPSSASLPSSRRLSLLANTSLRRSPLPKTSLLHAP